MESPASRRTGRAKHLGNSCLTAWPEPALLGCGLEGKWVGSGSESPWGLTSLWKPWMTGAQGQQTEEATGRVTDGAGLPGTGLVLSLNLPRTGNPSALGTLGPLVTQAHQTPPEWILTLLG